MNDTFNQYPPVLTKRLQTVRNLILRLAAKSPNVGEVVESVKWGQASFATVRPKSGTPLRIAGDVEAGTYSVYVPCKTSLISDFRSTHPDMFDYHGSREIRLKLNAALPEKELSLFISAALTYYLD